MNPPRALHPGHPGPGSQWLAEAEATVMAWTDTLHQHVLDLFPYPPERGIRNGDWLTLVAHISTRKDEDPLTTAQRLSLYVKTYAETRGVTLTPTKLKETQS